MAVKDHSLDDKIIKAALSEFMKYGFEKASLHKIADKAGITTGALYTRYKNKDALFCSLAEASMSAIKGLIEPLHERYREVHASKDVGAFLAAIREEEESYLNLLFQYYDECILFFCRSKGSSIETMVETMMESKAAGTVAFLKSMAQKEIDWNGVELIIMEQFYFHCQILEKGYSREQAISCMKTVGRFLEAGWKDLFEQII